MHSTQTHTRRSRRSGFTLIELLVVVAVIAILAAIALPNFLEAQTRAKLSRVKSDIRSISVGLEAYAVDNNRYPYIFSANRHTYLADAPGLTTPIAYLSDLPREVFVADDAPGERERTYRYYSVDYWKQYFPALELRNWKWIVMSNAPDRRIDVDGENAQDAIYGRYYMVYDPTNGTISPGDIWFTNLGSLGG